jgi:hypothetical protein
LSRSCNILLITLMGSRPGEIRASATRIAGLRQRHTLPH